MLSDRCRGASSGRAGRLSKGWPSAARSLFSCFFLFWWGSLPRRGRQDLQKRERRHANNSPICGPLRSNAHSDKINPVQGNPSLRHASGKTTGFLKWPCLFITLSPSLGMRVAAVGEAVREPRSGLMRLQVKLARAVSCHRADRRLGCLLACLEGDNLPDYSRGFPEARTCIPRVF